jgi:hypothetical protein
MEQSKKRSLFFWLSVIVCFMIIGNICHRYDKVVNFSNTGRGWGGLTGTEFRGFPFPFMTRPIPTSTYDVYQTALAMDAAIWLIVSFFLVWVANRCLESVKRGKITDPKDEDVDKNKIEDMTMR